MLGFLLRRLLWMIPTTIGIVLVVFALFHAVPGDPVLVVMGAGDPGLIEGQQDEARLEAFRREHGLDRSLLVQFLCVIGPFNLLSDGHPWFRSPRAGGGSEPNSGERPWGGLLALDLGREMHTRASVARELAPRLAVTVPLSLAAVLCSYAIAIPLGVFSARRRGSRIDALVAFCLYALHSVPAFWGGLLLIMLFGVTGPDLPFWPRLPVLGLHDKDAAAMGPWKYALDTLAHCILPVVTMSYASLAYLARQMRSGMVDALGEEFVRSLRAHGLPERSIVYRHALRHALLPLVTLFGAVLPMLIGGSVIVETVFDLPGVGKYAYEGLLRRDLSVVMATTLLMGIMTQLGLLLSDLAYGVVDPRIRHA